VAKPWLKLCDLMLGLLALGGFNVGGFDDRIAEAQTYSSTEPSWTDSFKQGFAKIGNALSPTKTSVNKKEDEAIALNGKGKPEAKLYVQMAHLFEDAKNYPDAEKYYKLALADKKDDSQALMGYAQLQDHLGKTEDAIRLYQTAAKAHPQEGAIFNNMGLCYARAKRLSEATMALARAVQLEPKNALYRNNLATVLVDQGRYHEALGQLQAVHPEASAYYNMGYLLNKKHLTQEALQYFVAASQADPSLVPAKQWVEYLQHKLAQSRLPQSMEKNIKVVVPSSTLPQERSMETEIAENKGVENRCLENKTMPETPIVKLEPSRSQDPAPMPPNTSLAPKRLPPTNSRESATVVDGPSLSGLYYGNSNNSLVAPLPPVTASRPGSESASSLFK
jgi:tetratricopeptide (TPR) repeat protein